jgi:hypothetical protein
MACCEPVTSFKSDLTKLNNHISVVYAWVELMSERSSKIDFIQDKHATSTLIRQNVDKSEIISRDHVDIAQVS